MRKHIIFSTCFLSLIAAGCSQEDYIKNVNNSEQSITIQADIDNKSTDTRLTYTDENSKLKSSWSDEESITLYHGIEGTGKTFKKTADSNNSFVGNLPEGNGTYYATYGNGITKEKDNLTVNIAKQIGTVNPNGIKSFMIAETDDPTNGLTFKNKLTVVKLNLTFPTGTEGTVKQVSISGLHNKAAYSLSTKKYTYNDEDKLDLTATNNKEGFAINENKIIAYVSAFPENAETNSVTISALINSDEYACTMKSAKQLAEGKVTNINVTLQKVERKNIKETYIETDYSQWIDGAHSIATAPTVTQMVAYINDGIYWDTKGPEYTKPNGVKSKTGLWIHKKQYIPEFDNTTAITPDSDKTKPKYLTGNSANVSAEDADKIRTGGEYFFLPAAGFYNNNFEEGNGDFVAYFWLSTTGSTTARCFKFRFSTLNIGWAERNLKYLPMIAE